MDALRALRASSHLFHWAAARTTRARAIIVRCSSSVPSTAAAAAAAPPPRTSSYRRSSRSSTSTSDRESIHAIQLKKVDELRSMGCEPYAYNWDRSHTTNQLQLMYSHLENGEECKEDSVSVAGRIIAHRTFGTLAVLRLRDDTGTIQLYCEKESLSKDQFEHLKTLIDVGDIIGASGLIKKTEKGELSVYVKAFAVLTKSLLPLPDKYHGLTDIDKRYRQRYVDMIANPEVAEVFRTRAKVTSKRLLVTASTTAGARAAAEEVGSTERRQWRAKLATASATTGAAAARRGRERG